MYNYGTELVILFHIAQKQEECVNKIYNSVSFYTSAILADFKKFKNRNEEKPEEHNNIPITTIW